MGQVLIPAAKVDRLALKPHCSVVVSLVRRDLRQLVVAVTKELVGVAKVSGVLD